MPNFAKIQNVRGLYGYCTGFVRGPRSLHFRGRRPIPRLRELASSSARPAAALRDQAFLRLADVLRGLVAERELGLLSSRKFSAKFSSFSAVSAPIFARKYEFCSIFQNLQDYVAAIFEIWQTFADLATFLKFFGDKAKKFRKLTKLDFC